jgi:hypothetical protein
MIDFYKPARSRSVRLLKRVTLHIKGVKMTTEKEKPAVNATIALAQAASAISSNLNTRTQKEAQDKKKPEALAPYLAATLR